MESTPAQIAKFNELLGLTLVLCQMAEKAIVNGFIICFPDGGVHKAETYLRWHDKWTNQTGGRVIEHLQKKVGIDPDIEDLLTRFVKNRNTLVHDLERISGYDDATVEGLEVGKRFVTELCKDAYQVSGIFVALLVAVSRDTGFESDAMLQKHQEFYKSDFFVGVERLVPHLEELFFEKT
jgi:hypothetical protein